jgi:hypothetical protein
MRSFEAHIYTGVMEISFPDSIVFRNKEAALEAGVEVLRELNALDFPEMPLTPPRLAEVAAHLQAAMDRVIARHPEWRPS